MCARTRSGFTASSPPASATGSACCKACRASAPRSRSAFSARSRRKRLSAAIARQDKAMMARAPGVGPKLAARLVLELKDKAPACRGRRFRQRNAGVERAPKLAEGGRGRDPRPRRPRLRRSRRPPPRSPGFRLSSAPAADRRADPRGPEGAGAVSGRRASSIRHDRHRRAVRRTRARRSAGRCSFPFPSSSRRLQISTDDRASRS